MAGYLLGIDNGGTVTKAAIYDLQGREVAVCGCRSNIIMSKPEFAERDSEELWSANVKVIRDAIEKSGIDPGLISGIAVTGHGNGMYLVDEYGRPAYMGIMSHDTRAKEFVESWNGDGTAERVRRKTLQAVYAGQPVALLAWLKKYSPEVLNNTKWVLMCKDYIRFRLTGAVYAEITDTSAANLMDVTELRYDEELLKEFGLEDMLQKLPPLKYSSEICGYITPDVAALTGLKEGTPVAGGMCDMDACAIATGMADEESFCVIAGTWSINQYISRKPVVSDKLFLCSNYCMEDFWLITEASATSAGNLEWFSDRFLGEEKRLAREKGMSVYGIIDEMIAGTKPEDSNIIFMPFLFGSNAGPDTKSCFIGLSGWHSKAQILRAIYEGVVFCHLDHIDRLLAHREKPKAMRISGGAARSTVWVRIFADILQCDIEVVRGTELGTFGAAICAGVANGSFESYESAIGSMVETAYVCKPDPDKKDIYARKYSHYKSVLAALEPVWKELGK